MTDPKPAIPVKVFISAFSNKREILQRVKKTLITTFGEIDSESSLYKFNFTSYYEEEFGKDLLRVFFSFKRLKAPDYIVEMKIKTHQIETLFMKEKKRQINLDPGYLDYHKIVLASFKPGPLKVYLQKGVYGDIVRIYQKKQFISPHHSFPDFRSGLYDVFFYKLRQIYKENLASL